MTTIANVNDSLISSAPGVAESFHRPRQMPTRTTASIGVPVKAGFCGRFTMAALAAMTLLHAIFVLAFYVPVHGGTDQNGYQVTARLLSEGNGASFRSTSPFQFVGNMMVMTQTGRIYAKYPPGYPLMAAAARVLNGTAGMYRIDPLCTVVACSLSYFLFRECLGEFASLVAVLWLSWNPVIISFANDANSHAATLLCVIAGAWGMLGWLRSRTLWRGMLGGFALGYAATVRYSEALLVLPVVFAVAMHWLTAPTMARDRARQCEAVLISWAVPVCCLALFCWAAFGAPWKSGYAYCSEDSAFGWKYFIGDAANKRPGNWETLIAQINWMGLLILWPMGLLGVLTLGVARAREGTFITLWMVPGTVLYLLYYWAPGGETTLGYLRFFVPVLPGLILCGLAFIERGIGGAPIGGPLALGLLTALGLSVNLWNTFPSLESNLAARQALARTAGYVRSHAPEGSNLFVADENLSNDLDVAGGYHLYNLFLFRNSSFSNFDRTMTDPSGGSVPDPRQRLRMALYWHLLGYQAASGEVLPKSNEELERMQDDLLNGMFRSKQRTFFLLKTGQNRDWLPDEARWQSTTAGSIVSDANSTIAVSPIAHWSSTAPPAPSLRTTNWTLYEIQPVPGE